MQIEFTGVVVDGKLNLNEPILLPDHAAVKVSVAPVEVPTREERLAKLQNLQRYCEEQKISLGGRRFTRDELYDRR